MPEKKSIETVRDDGVELETQVILRIPEEPARAIREAIRDGSNNLKDRLTVKLENDVRYGEVRFDHWLMYAKVVDIPTILESLKTIDNKSFYKSADVCQMIICKFEPDQPSVEEETPNKNKKKDPNKVDKKYLWPHGITPPCKNIRKRRFRKTLKKKYVEAPEIEKEVKRLLRADNEAVNVKWEIVNDDEEKNLQLFQSESCNGNSEDILTPTTSSEKIKRSKPKEKASDIPAAFGSQMPRDIDIFGEDVSSSDDDENNINIDVDETSRISGDDSRMSDYSTQATSEKFEQFKNILGSPITKKTHEIAAELNLSIDNNIRQDVYTANTKQETDDGDYINPQEYQENVNLRIQDLKRQLSDLNSQRVQKEQEISFIVNQALRQRLQDSLDIILGQIVDKEMEIQDLQSMAN